LQQDPNFPFSTNPELPQTGEIVVSCRLKKDGQNIYAFTVTIVVIDVEDIIANPAEFNFLLRNGFNETKTDILKIINPINKTFSINYPFWLDFNFSGGNTTSDFSFSTINSEKYIRRQ
jgi:hypothetical protein